MPRFSTRHAILHSNENVNFLKNIFFPTARHGRPPGRAPAAVLQRRSLRRLPLLQGPGAAGGRRRRRGGGGRGGPGGEVRGADQDHEEEGAQEEERGEDAPGEFYVVVLTWDFFCWRKRMVLMTQVEAFRWENTGLKLTRFYAQLPFPLVNVFFYN